MQGQQNKNFEMLPVAMKEQFDVQKTEYDPKDDEVSVSFSGNKEYQSFTYVYCHLCSNKVLKKSYWEVYLENLPKNVSGIRSKFLVASFSTILLTPYISTPK